MQLFTSESVTSGHPDKVCDRISDTILDALLEQDPQARVAVETLTTTGLVHVAGEVSTTGYVEIPQLVRDAITDIGYNSSEMHFDGNSCGVLVALDSQSPDISGGVNVSEEVREGGDASDRFESQGAGDQGLMFGYACDETPDLMPLPIWLAHRLAERLERVRREGLVSGLYPDGKTQVTIGYDGIHPVALDTVVVSTQHSESTSVEDLKRLLPEAVIEPVLKEANLGLDLSALKTYINPAGPFHLGGPAADTGVTGRKIIVDTYGGMARHGGGAFSGKDPSKVDRSASYAMRWVAKHIVAAGLAKRCELQVAYAIGRSHPVGVSVECFGTNTQPEDKILAAVLKTFDLRPAAIIEHLDLKRPIYAETSAYGHFGRPGFPWEELSRVDELLANL